MPDNTHSTDKSQDIENTIDKDTIEQTKYGKIKHIDVVDEMEKSYLDYAMSVIVSRALPDVRDGLKPVHRRILYSMYKSGIHHNSPYKKSARIVGDVLGRYHPHGDMPVYMALVRLAQPFSMRYPLIDGQGNFGSIDGDSPAAMRYTEARLSKISRELLEDINKNTVDMVENFDGSLKEPTVLPAKLPNLLLAGSEGIAVGMATKIPPHNIVEVCEAIKATVNKCEVNIDLSNQNIDTQKIKQDLEKEQTNEEFRNQINIAQKLIDLDFKKLKGSLVSEITVDEIMEYIQGPDFPTGAIIFDFESIKQAYRTGKGKVIIRAKTQISKNNKEIFITEIPYQVNKAKLIQKIADLVRNKKITSIKNIRDDSDRRGLQITIELKRDSNPQVVLNKLFKYSDLQTSFPINMVALDSEGVPRLMNIKQILNEYIKHRQEVIIRRSQFLLKEAKDRAHILDGLLIALAHLDDVIETIKTSKDTDQAKQRLMQRFSLSEVQATAILEMQLKRLAALERQKLEQEYEEIKARIKDLIQLLITPSLVLKAIIDDLDYLIENYKDKRRTKLVKSKIQKFSEEKLIAQEKTFITLTERGYIKRLTPNALRAQSRGGKGAKGIKMQESDFVKDVLAANTHDDLLFFTNLGRVFKLKAYKIPESNKQSKGKAIVNLIKLKPNEKVETILNIKNIEENLDKYIIIVTKKGLIKKTKLDQYKNIRQSGIIAITLNKNDNLVWAHLTSGEDQILIATKKGKSIRFREKEVKASSRDTKGVKAITIMPNDFVAGVVSISKEDIEDKNATVFSISENGIGKRSLLSEYTIQKRGGIGIKVAELNNKTGSLCGIKLITSKHKNIVILTKLGQSIKIPISKKSIPILKRPTQGVILIKLNKNDKVVAFDVTVKD